MDIGEIVASAVAILALVLACLNTYFQFFRKKDDLKVSILELRPVSAEVCVDLVFSNTGNRSGTIFRVSLAVPVGTRGGISLYPWSRLDDEPQLDSITINPGELVHRRVYFPFSVSKIDNVVHGGIPDDTSLLDIDAELRFSMVDSAGRNKERSLPGIQFGVRHGKFESYGHKLNNAMRLLP